MATLYDLAQAYLNRGLPDISGIFGDNTNNTLSPIDFGGEEPVSPQGLTPEQLALLYSQNNNVNKGGGDSSNFIGTIPENYYTPQGAGTISNNNILDGSITSDLVDEFAPNRFSGISSFGLANNPDEEEEDYVEQSKLGKFGNAFQTLRESPFSTIASISQGLPGIIANLAFRAKRGGTNYQQFTPGMTYNQNASMINDAYDPATGTNRFDRAKPGTFGSFRTLADYFGRDKNDGPGSTTGNTTEATQDNQDGFGGSCFIAGTKVTMADGTLKNIEDIKVGDKVKGHKEDNEVIKLDPTLLANRKLYSFNNNEHYFFTSEHPFMTEEGWKSVKPEKTKERDGVELYNQLKGELKIGDKLVTDKGLIEITDIKSKEINKPDMPLYNFNVSNDNSYIADNYIVHNKGGGGGGGGMGAGMCFDPSTPIQMADGSIKEIKNIQLGDDTKGGKVTGVFQFKAADEIHDYKGVTVAGSHFVKEDDKFIMVKDSPLAVKIDKIPVVYSLDTSGRRIFINDIEFADYNGDGVAKNFLNNAGVDLTGFDKEVLRQVEHRLI